MIPKATRFLHDIAFCEACADRDAQRVVPFLMALESLIGPMELTRTKGIVFWTPPVALPDVDAYLRWLDAHAKITGPIRPMSDTELLRALDHCGTRESPCVPASVDG